MKKQDPQTPENDPRGAAFAAYSEAFALQRAAGRQEQLERARNNPPPRKIMRSLGSMKKTGRRGRKARARIQREIIRKVGDVKL